MAVTISLYVVSSLALWHFHKVNTVKSMQEIYLYNDERETIDSNLRAQIVSLQNKLVNLPKIFSTNNRSLLLEKIGANYATESVEKITDQEVIKELFSRNERKELFSGGIIVQTDNNKLYFTIGLMDENGEFTYVVERHQLQSENSNADYELLNSLINSKITEGNDKTIYEEKIAVLKQICIDSAFEAEKTRLEFVSTERDVTQTNNKLIQTTQDYNQKWLQAILAILSGNVICALILGLWSSRKSGSEETLKDNS